MVRWCSSSSTTIYGTGDLTINSDRTWSVDPPMPPEAEIVCALMGWQSETLSLSVDECVAALREADAEPGQYTLSYYSWSVDQAFTFNAATRSFKAIASA